MRVVPLALLTLLLALPLAVAEPVDTARYNPMVEYDPPSTQQADLFGGGSNGQPVAAGTQTQTSEVGADARYLRTTYTRQGSFAGTFTQTAPDGTALDATSTLSLDGGLRITRTVVASPGALTLEETGVATGARGLEVLSHTEAPAAPLLEVELDGSYTSLDPTQYTRLRFHVPQGTDELDVRLQLAGTSGGPVTLYDARGTPVAGLPATSGAADITTTVPATGGLWTLTLKGPIAGTFHAAVGAPGTLA